MGGGCKARQGQSGTERSGERVTEAEVVSNPAPRHKADLWVDMSLLRLRLSYLLKRDSTD